MARSREVAPSVHVQGGRGQPQSYLHASESWRHTGPGERAGGSRSPSPQSEWCAAARSLAVAAVYHTGMKKVRMDAEWLHGVHWRVTQGDGDLALREVHIHLHCLESVKLQVVVTAPGLQMVKLPPVSRPVPTRDESDEGGVNSLHNIIINMLCCKICHKSL